MHRLMDQLDELFEEMEELGCHYKDWNFSVGLVDFPAILDGKEVLLCWRSGQRSPIHNHPGAVGGVRVLRGIATETLFDFGPCGLVKATFSRDLRTGDVAASQDSDMHQLSNLQVEGQDLMTLHIYSPPLLRMRTYSLTDRSTGEFRPEIFEHSFGSGI